MFCPSCRAEYRAGFARCSDCGVELIETLPLTEESHPPNSVNDRPDEGPFRYFLAWFLPMGLYLVLFFLVLLRPNLFRYSFVSAALIILSLASNTGAFWMLYQAIRYEKRVARYVLLSFVPFMFIWYSLVRYPLRRDLPRLS